jgi:uncharacterized protein
MFKLKLHSKTKPFIKWTTLAVCFILAVFSIPVFAQQLPDKPNPPRLVNDFAKIFNAEEAGMLEQKLVAYNDSTSTQIVIVTVTSLDGYPVDDYSFQLGNKWGIGQKGKNNGILVLIAKDDRKAFIATGYGMEGALNDGKLGTILRKEMIPYFKSGDYYGGVNNGIDWMIAAAGGEFVSEDGGGRKKKRISAEGILGILFIIFIIFLIGFYTAYRSAKKYSILNNVPFWVAWSIINAAANNRRNNSGGGFFGSGGGFGGGSSSGGGFGGFGGGSFGGGGAGGSW